MFDNIGSKMKMMAKVMCWLGMALSVAAGILLMTLDSVFYGLLTMIVGSLYSWTGSFRMYGQGQLIENTDRLIAGKSGAADNQGTKPGQDYIPVAPVLEDKAQDDGYVDMYCGGCGELLSFRSEDMQQECLTCPMCGVLLQVKAENS